MKREARGRVLTGALAFLLLAVFAVGATQLTLLGAQAYRATVARSQTHNRERIVPAVIRSAVRAGNAAGAVSVEKIDGVCCLTVRSEEEGRAYLRRCMSGKGICASCLRPPIGRSRRKAARRSAPRRRWRRK